MERPRQRIERGMFVREYPGDSKLPVIVYIHGLGESGLCFEEIARSVCGWGWRQLIPDLPGYGRSVWPAAPQSFAGVVSHVSQWLRDRGERKVLLLGHSLGGVLALLFAESHPESVRGVIDIDGNKSLADCTFSGQAAAVPQVEFSARVFHRLREAVFEGGSSEPALRGYYASLRLADPQTFHAQALELVALSAAEKLAARLAALPCAKLYIAGAPGGASPRSLALLTAAGIDSAIVSPAGHWPFIDQPDQFAALVRSFLGRL